MSDLIDKRGIEITPEYREVLNLLRKRYVLTLVCGKAGSGKTTLIDFLRSEFGQERNIVVVAPTGVAALNAGGVTIHSFFRFPPHLLQPDDIHKVHGLIYKHMDLLIIDEISMVRADILDNIDRFLRINRNRPDTPFGGVQVLLIGDLYQLPPIAKDKVEIAYLKRIYGDHAMFWNSLAAQVYGMAVLELSHIFRQVDPEFTALLNQIRTAENLPQVLRDLNAQGAPSSTKPSSLITLTATNQVAEEINTRQLEALPGKLLCARARIVGDFRLSGAQLPAPECLYLRQGAQVMFTRNDEDKQWVNGTLGRVVDVRDCKPFPEIVVELLTSLTSDNSGVQVTVQPVKWEIFKYKVDHGDRIVPEVIGSFVQYPLMLAWAITIHKSQGKTLERVCVNLGSGAFASGQVYVALSRCRSISDLTLSSPLRTQDIQCDPHVRRFFTSLEPFQTSESGIQIFQNGPPQEMSSFKFRESTQAQDSDFRY